MKIIGVLKEHDDLETRVALVPEVVNALHKHKLAQLVIEAGAGLKSGFLDQDYIKSGAEIINSPSDLVKKADIITAVNLTNNLNNNLDENINLSNKIIIGLSDPYNNINLINNLKKQQATLLALELIPRISRAQSMDVLSSQANIAGYVAVLKAANKLGKVLPLLMTAAGTIKPAKILVLGAGVAGLSAIATAKRLGALVFAYDLRAVVKEQVESLGAKFVDINIAESGEGSGGYAKALSEQAARDQRTRLTDYAKDFDIIICTALIPGMKAPRLLNDDIFVTMHEGSVIIDMAAISGGNVAGSVPNEWKKIGQALVYGADNLSRQVPKDASFTFSKNIYALLELFLAKNKSFDLNDEILSETTLCHEGNWINKKIAAHMIGLGIA